MAAKRKTTAAGNDDILLPPEIWGEILIRLPAKSVLRCRSVCKSWYSLISCPNFISDYSNKNEDRVLVQNFDEHWSSFNSLDESFMESREHDDVPKEWLGDIPGPDIVGSCNGLICLCKYEVSEAFRATFLIWNPAIRKTVELPWQTINPGRRRYIGFGFDSKINDHKVLCTKDANVLGIFDLKKGVWRGIPTPILVHSWKLVSCPTYPDCYVNGAVHWSGSNMIILSFDMTDECFREIRMPDCAEFTPDDNTFPSIRSVTFGGLLHVIVWKTERKVFVNTPKSCSVWAMKEYGVTESLTKVYNVDMFWPYYFRLWGNGEVLMVRNHSGDKRPGNGQNLVLFNTGSGESKRIFSTTKRIMDLRLYKESLFLMCGTG